MNGGKISLVDTEEKEFRALLSMELRRQGVTQQSECERHVLAQLMVVETQTETEVPDTPSNSTSVAEKGANVSNTDHAAPGCLWDVKIIRSAMKTREFSKTSELLNEDKGTVKRELPGQTRCTFELDLSELCLGNKVVIAICETLLKLTSINEASGVRWHLLFKRNDLTDRCVKHLCFIILSCPCLALLVLTDNKFSEEGLVDLRQAIAKSVYKGEVHLDGAIACRGTLNDISRPSSKTGEASRDRIDKGLTSSRTDCDLSSIYPPTLLSENISATSANERLRLRNPQRSFSSAYGRHLSAAATHDSLALGTGAGIDGSAEALQRRREELFGTRALHLPSDAGCDEDANATSSTLNGASDTGHTPSPAKVPFETSRQSFADAIETGRVSGEAPVGSAQPVQNEVAVPCQTPVPFSESSSLQLEPTGEEDSSGSSHPCNEAEEDAGCDESYQLRTRNKSTNRILREPFEDDQALNLTISANPVVGSVLDLSRAVEAQTGRLRQSYSGMGAQTVWDIIGFHHGQDELLGHGQKVSPRFPERLPPALAGRKRFDVITALNISDNHLKQIQALPPRLLQLDISGNDLVELSGLESCTMLSLLNARRNRISRIAGIERNTCLVHLLLGRNHIKAVEGLGHLLMLETLDVSNNLIRTQSGLRALSLCSALRELFLRGNPVLDHMPHAEGCFAIVRNLCPSLMLIDGKKLSRSRFAEKIEREENYMRQPMLIHTTHQPRISFDVDSGVRSAAMPSNRNASTISQEKPSPPLSFVINSTGTAIPRGRAARGEEMCENVMNLLYFLTHSSNSGKGYSGAAHTTRAAHCLKGHNSKLRGPAEKAKKVPQHLPKSSSLRAEKIKMLGQKSKKYIEESILGRIAECQQVCRDSSGGEVRDFFQSPATETHRVTVTASRSDADEKLHRPARDSRAGERSDPPAASSYPDFEDIDVLKPYTLKRFHPPRHPLRASRTRDPSSKATISTKPSLFPSCVLDQTVPSATYPHRVCLSARHSGSPPDQGSGSFPVTSQRSISYTQLYASERALQKGAALSKDLGLKAPERSCSPLRELAGCGVPPNAPFSKAPGHLKSSRMGCSRSSKRNLSHSPLLKREQSSASTGIPRTGRTPASTSPAGHFSTLPRKPRTDPTREHRCEQLDNMHSNYCPLNGHCELSDNAPWTSGNTHRSCPGVAVVADNPHQGCSVPRLTPSATTSLPTSILIWEKQLEEDITTVQEALEAILFLFRAQKQDATCHDGQDPCSVPPAHLQQRLECSDIIRKSGMLDDVKIPKEVVSFYRYDKNELEGRSVCGQGEKGGNAFYRERMSTLNSIRMLVDAKTCLRYLVILLDSGDQSLLEDYVGQVRDTLTIE